MISYRLTMSGSDFKRAMIETLSPLFRETIFRGLSTFRTLIILSTLKLSLVLGFIESSEEMTLTKSIMFQLLRR